MKRLLVLGVAAVLVGACGGSGSVQVASEGSCAAVVLWNGVEYTGSGIRLSVEPGPQLGEGTVPRCGDSAERTVDVFSIVDVDPGLAVLTDEPGTVYVAPGVIERGTDLPAPLVGAFYGAPCSASEPYVVEGALVGAGDEGGEPLAIGIETKEGYLNALVDEETLGPNTYEALAEFSGSDRFRLSVSCIAGDRPDLTYHADEIAFLANGPYCGKNGNPCHASFGSATTVVKGGTNTQRALVFEILAALGPTAIKRVIVGTSRLSFELLEAPGLRAEWESWLVASAYQGRAAAFGLEPLAWVDIADGGFAVEAGGRTAWPDDLGELVRAIHRAGEASGRHSDEFAILRTGGVAPAVTWKVDEPAQFLKHDLPKALEAFGDPWRFEGFYFEALDVEGTPFWSWAGASRFHTGGVWTRPDLEDCNPIVHSRPAGYEPPPCPA
jgi:hypothetical protein